MRGSLRGRCAPKDLYPLTRIASAMRSDLSPQAGRGNGCPSTNPPRRLTSLLCRRPIPYPSRRLKRLRCCPTASGAGSPSRGWSPREHQLALLAKARDDRSALLIAPTGAGKTLAGFLPTLVELSSPAASKGGGEKSLISTGRGVKRTGGLHTLYISPLKALAVDIARNLETPIAEMGLPIKVETRTGDTPVSRRQRQRRYPPDILLTTPEQLALLLSSDDAPFLFSSLKRIVLDELHALVTSKRGDLLSLGLARLWRLAPRDARDRAVGDGGRAGIAGAVSGAAARRQGSLRRHRRGRRRGGARRRDARHQGAPALGRPHRAPCARRNVRADQAQQDHADLRQHPQPGRNAVPGFLAHERRRPRHCAASRLARRRAAPQGRGRDGGGQTARRGLHLLARPRHRLGRHRSRHQCRRAQGRLAADAADRPRQPPARRTLARGADSRQSLRGAGMPRRDRCDRGECAGYAAACAPARSTCWRSTCSAAPAASRSCPTNSTRKC